MKSVIVFRDGHRVDLSGGVDAGDYAELENTQGRGTRKEPLLFCGGCRGGVYVRHGTERRDVLYGAHFEAVDCPADLRIRKSVMSDEHKRMQEYTVRAAEGEGFAADTEVRTSGRTVVDVVIDGRVGVEVQRSLLTAGAAVQRTGRSMAAGLEVVAWCAERRGVAWRGRVPGFEWLDPWQVRAGLPQPQSAWSSGLYTLRSERFGATWKPVLEPLRVLVDEAVVRMAAGTVKPVIWESNVQLMRADGIALYEEMAGRALPPFTGAAPDRALAASPGAPCLRPRVRDTAMADEEFWCDACGSKHPLREHRDCRRRKT